MICDYCELLDVEIAELTTRWKRSTAFVGLW